MLPGLRFLFAAMVLATSLLVFGLGAAALFRAAHEEFASIPARRALPEPQFAQQPEVPPVLAMVRVEPSATDKTVADSPAPSTPSEPAASVAAAPAEASLPAEPEKVAAEDRIRTMSSEEAGADAVFSDLSDTAGFMNLVQQYIGKEEVR